MTIGRLTSLFIKEQAELQQEAARDEPERHRLSAPGPSAATARAASP